MITIEGASVFLPDEVVETTVTIADGKIAEIGGPLQGEVYVGGIQAQVDSWSSDRVLFTPQTEGREAGYYDVDVYVVNI